MNMSSSIATHFKNLVNKRFGIVQQVNYTYPEISIPGMHHCYAHMANTLAFSTQQNVRYGKGVSVSREKAMLKAIGEGLERYCSAIYNQKLLLFLPAEQMTKTFLPPKDVCLYTESFYHSHPRYTPFTDKTAIHWFLGKNLKNEVPTYLPATMVYLPYYPSNEEARILQNISTGLACHDTCEQATMTAICEVLERDAFMIFWRLRLPPPRLKTTSLPSTIQHILHQYQSQGLTIHIYSITTDVQIPTILVTMESQRPDQPSPIIAGACSISAERAIISALEEMELSRQHAYAFHKKDKSYISPQQVKTPKDHMLFWLQPSFSSELNFLKNSTELIDYKDFVKLSLHDCPELSSIDQLKNRVLSAGMDIYIADLTTEDIRDLDMHVIRAVIPQAHPLAFGYEYDQFNCARLASVPPKLGYAKGNVASPYLPHPYP